MKYVTITREGFRQYMATNENGKIVRTGMGINSYDAIICCFEAEFDNAFKFKGAHSCNDIEMLNRIEIYDNRGEYYLIDKSEPENKYLLKWGDYVIMDCSKNIYIGQMNMKATQHVSV